MQKLSFWASSLFAAIIAVVPACKNDHDHDDITGFGDVEIEFDHQAGSSALVLGNEYTTAAGEQVRFTTFDYFVSNFVLTNKDGFTYTVPKNECYFLVKHDDPDSREIKLKNIPAGDYTGLRFTIGVDSAKSVSPIAERTGALDPKKYRVAHLTGTMQLKLGEMEKIEIKNFITGGGFLIVDAAGGNQPFSNDVQTLLEGMFPEEARALNSPLPVDHVIYTKADGALRPGDTTYRSFARRGLGADARTPRLRGMTVKDGTSERVAVFFSPEDLSTALVGMPVDGIYGYSPATATLLMQKMLIYAQANGKF